LIRDSAGPAALALMNQKAASHLGMEAGAPKATPQTRQLAAAARRRTGKAIPRLRVISA
jgi:hypothetical protein